MKTQPRKRNWVRAVSVTTQLGTIRMALCPVPEMRKGENEVKMGTRSA